MVMQVLVLVLEDELAALCALGATRIKTAAEGRTVSVRKSQ
jgi:hypothetical protein